jgi:hypothetical protein
MIQLLWRQHRGEFVFYGGLLLLWCVFALVVGNQMNAAMLAFQHQGCDTNNAGQACSGLLGDYIDRFHRILTAMSLVLQITPVFAGMLIGAPLIAREFEQRTHLFVWVQSITRRRWAISKIGATLIFFLLAATVYSAIFAWCVSQGYQINGNILAQGNPYTQYDITGIVPLVYIAFALAAGIAAGTIFRRTIVAMVVVLFGYPIMRTVIASFRYSWVTPATYTYLSYGTALPAWVTDGRFMGSGYVDVHGALVSPDTVTTTCGPSASFAADCLQSHGWMNFIKVIPASDFWMIQGAEAALFGLLALGLLTLAVWQIVRRGE